MLPFWMVFPTVLDYLFQGENDLPLYIGKSVTCYPASYRISSAIMRPGIYSLDWGGSDNEGDGNCRELK
jgi:hypothetical protein